MLECEKDSDCSKSPLIWFITSSLNFPRNDFPTVRQPRFPFFSLRFFLSLFIRKIVHVFYLRQSPSLQESLFPCSKKRWENDDFGYARNEASKEWNETIRRSPWKKIFKVDGSLRYRSLPSVLLLLLLSILMYMCMR